MDRSGPCVRVVPGVRAAGAGNARADAAVRVAAAGVGAAAAEAVAAFLGMDFKGFLRGLKFQPTMLVRIISGMSELAWALWASRWSTCGVRPCEWVG